METGSSNSNANLRRAISWLVNRDCAMITAWRKEKKDGAPKTRAENDNDNKTLVQKLCEYGYGVSKVQGCYAEVGHPLSRENSFFVFGLLNNSKLFFLNAFSTYQLTLSRMVSSTKKKERLHLRTKLALIISSA